MAAEKISLASCTLGEYYAALDASLRRFKHMNLKRWKLIQNTLISALMIWFAIEAGADPTITIITVALINGVSMADLAAMWGNGISISLAPNEDADLEQTETETADESETEAEADEQ